VPRSGTLWRNYLSFNTTCRHAGTRCADLLCAEVGDFDISAMSLGSLYWHLGAAGGCANFAVSPTPADLRRLAPGDSAVLRPGCTKADPFAIEFGDKPIYLPWDPGDITNADTSARASPGAHVCHGACRSTSRAISRCSRPAQSAESRWRSCTG